MSATLQRDQATALAKTDSKKALEKARLVSEPWFRAQALSWVARFADGDPGVIAALAAKAAAVGNVLLSYRSVSPVSAVPHT